MIELEIQFADIIDRINPDDDQSAIIINCSAGLKEYISDVPDEWKVNIRRMLLKYGAIVFRGFDIGSVTGLETFISDISTEGNASLIPYEGERASPRSLISSFTYTSTEYEATNSIYIHNEMSSRQSWPKNLFFYCRKKSESGGNTPICNIRKVTLDVSKDIQAAFDADGIKYIRNYGGRFGVDIEYGFGTTNRDEIEDYCNANDIQFEWVTDTHFRTSFCRPAFELHPETREKLWFNYATFYDVNSIDPKLRSLIKRMTTPEQRSFAAMFANGNAISDEYFEHLRSVYDKHTYEFDWQNGDLLALDNMLYGHGRKPYYGKRSVWVVMAEETHRTNILNRA